MSYKELITNINFVNKFEEHRFTVGRGIALLIFLKSLHIFLQIALVLQTNEH